MLQAVPQEDVAAREAAKMRRMAMQTLFKSSIIEHAEWRKQEV